MDYPVGSETKSVLVPVANGSEDLETVAIVDILRRAGASVILASVEGDTIRGSRGIGFLCDRLISECTAIDFDLIVLPGGMPGAERLKGSRELCTLLKHQAEKGKLFAAICAAPAVVLEPLGLLTNRKAVCHPSFVSRLPVEVFIEAPVVKSGNCITAAGPGAAMNFSLTLVETLYGISKAQLIAAELGIPLYSDYLRF